MTNKRRNIVFASAGIAMAAIAILVAGRGDQTKYHGKTFEEWFVELPASGNISTNQQFIKVLQAAGSNAVPALLNHLRATESFKGVLLKRASAATWLPLKVRNFASHELFAFREREYRAANAMGELRTDARTAIPELVEAMCDPNRRPASFAAISSLGRLGPEGLMALYASLRNAPQDQSVHVLHELQQTHRDVEQTVPEWMNLLRSSNAVARQWAALGLGDLGKTPDEAVPILVDLLASGDSYSRLHACLALKNLLPANPDAVVAIRHATTNSDSSVRRIAKVAVWKLETAYSTTNLHE